MEPPACCALACRSATRARPPRASASAAARADAEAKGKTGRRSRPSSRATGCCTTRSGWARSSPLEGVGDKAVASIDFGSEGVKRLLLRYAPVEKL